MFSQLCLAFLAATSVFSGIDARQIRKSEVHSRQIEAAKRWHTSGQFSKRATPQNITFKNPKASREFHFKPYTNT